MVFFRVGVSRWFWECSGMKFLLLLPGELEPARTRMTAALAHHTTKAIPIPPNAFLFESPESLDSVSEWLRTEHRLLCFALFPVSDFCGMDSLWVCDAAKFFEE